MKKLLFGLLFALLPVLVQAAPTCVQGAPGGPINAVLNWSPVTTNTDGTTIAGAQLPLAYNIGMGTASGTETTVATVSGSPQTVAVGLSAGKTYYFTVTTKDATGTLGAPSNEVCKVLPSSVPGSVTITIAKNGDLKFEFKEAS